MSILRLEAFDDVFLEFIQRLKFHVHHSFRRSVAITLLILTERRTRLYITIKPSIKMQNGVSF